MNWFTDLFGKSKWKEILYGNSMVGLNWPILASLIVDYIEHYNYQSNKDYICPAYIVDRKSLEDYSLEILLWDSKIYTYILKHYKLRKTNTRPKKHLADKQVQKYVNTHISDIDIKSRKVGKYQAIAKEDCTQRFKA